MTQADLANQRETLVQCHCGWRGNAPTDLVPNMGTSDLLCPKCYAKFDQWPPVVVEGTMGGKK